MSESRSLLRFGQTEAKILVLLWREGAGSSGDIREALGADALSLSGVSRILEKLKSKRLVSTARHGNQLIYSATLSRAELVKLPLSQMVQFFGAESVVELISESGDMGGKRMPIQPSGVQVKTIARLVLTLTVIFLSQYGLIIPELSIYIGA
jgi:predicted transcriptional regulator